MCAESNLCSNKYLHKTYASSVIKPELKMAFLTLWPVKLQFIIWFA